LPKHIPRLHQFWSIYLNTTTFLHYFDSFVNLCCTTNLNEEPDVRLISPPIVNSYFRYQSSTQVLE